MFRYTAGKADWSANGLAVAATHPPAPRVGDMARRDVPKCALTERAADVWERVRPTGWQLCVVVNADDIVLGVIHATTRFDADSTVEAVMEDGPATIRPNVSVTAATEHLQKHKVDHVLITTSDGCLVGVVRAEGIGA